jgi:predicted PurR-regulated permease PerM
MKKVKEEDKDQWDRKKILLAVITLSLIIFIALSLKTIFLPDEFSKTPKASVQGTSTRVAPPNIKEGVQKKIEELKQNAEEISIADVASSSPQVQKVINDLKSLQNYPSSQIKQACEKICSGL